MPSCAAAWEVFCARTASNSSQAGPASQLHRMPCSVNATVPCSFVLSQAAPAHRATPSRNQGASGGGGGILWWDPQNHLSCHIASISSSVLPLVSGTMELMVTTAATPMEANAK